MDILMATNVLLVEADALKVRAAEYNVLQLRIEKLEGNISLQDDKNIQREIREMKIKAESLENDAKRFLQLHSQYHETLEDPEALKPGQNPCPLCPQNKKKQYA